jgi:hypothetical protein
MLRSIIILIITLNYTVFTADSTYVNEVVEDESILTDSVSIDSSQVIIYFNALNELGKTEILSNSSVEMISKESIQEQSYTQLSDIFYKRTNFYPMGLGSFGLFNSMSIYGANPSQINFNFNGRPINDLQYGSLNPEQISLSCV